MKLMLKCISRNSMKEPFHSVFFRLKFEKNNLTLIKLVLDYQSMFDQFVANLGKRREGPSQITITSHHFIHIKILFQITNFTKLGIKQKTHFV